MSLTLSWEDCERPSQRVEGPNLLPMFGSSCKAFTQVECRDIHPCPRCKRNDFIGQSLCDKCNGTGLAEIPKGEYKVCMAKCHKSGLDHWKILQFNPKTDTPKDPPPPTSN